MDLTVLIPASDADWAVEAAGCGRSVEVLLDGALLPVSGRVLRADRDEADPTLIRAEMSWQPNP